MRIFLISVGVTEQFSTFLHKIHYSFLRKGKTLIIKEFFTHSQKKKLSIIIDGFDAYHLFLKIKHVKGVRSLKWAPVVVNYAIIINYNTELFFLALC